MNTFVAILLVFVILKLFFFSGILWVVFRDDIVGWMRKTPPVQAFPACMYCGSVYTHRSDDGEMRWENDELILVSMYQCEHCRLPFWHVERVPVGGVPRHPDVPLRRNQTDKF